MLIFFFPNNDMPWATRICPSWLHLMPLVLAPLFIIALLDSSELSSGCSRKAFLLFFFCVSRFLMQNSILSFVFLYFALAKTECISDHDIESL